MALSTTQYGYIIDPMVPFTDGKGNTIKDGFVRVFVAGSSTPVITYRNFDGSANQDLIELDNSGRTKTSVIGSKGLTYKVCVYDAFHSQESPILTVDKVSVIGANITAGTGSTVVTGIDGLTTKPDGFVDASVIGTDGYVALDHTLVTDDLNTDAKVTAVENDRYIPLLNDDVDDPDSKMTLGRLWQWVLGKIKSLSTTITAFRTGDVIPVDGPSGTAKMTADRIAERNDVGYTYIKTTSDSSVNLSESFTSGQKILVVAYTDSDVTATINGNIKFTDSSVQYPTISVVNGFGYKELTYNKDGHLGKFGGVGVSGKKVVFKVVVCDEVGESTLYGLINAIKEIADINVEQTPNVFASFKKIAIVGDSLGSGESVYKDSSNQFHYIDNYDYSWIQIMAKQNGQTAYNFSKGGEWCADWLDPSNARGITMAQSNPADCYFIGLGHNDSHVDRQETQPLGTIADVNVGSEGSNPSTFYGNYSKIIAGLKAITNKCRIFCVTSPNLESSAPQFNQAIRDVAGLYPMCYVLELGGDPYYASSFIESQKYAGHYSAAAYAAMATHINEILNNYIISHPSDFRGIQWIGTNYDVADGG